MEMIAILPFVVKVIASSKEVMMAADFDPVDCSAVQRRRRKGSV